MEKWKQVLYATPQDVVERNKVMRQRDCLRRTPLDIYPPCAVRRDLSHALPEGETSGNIFRQLKEWWK